MRPVAQGRPGTDVIPTGLAAAVAGSVVGTMTGRCTIRAAGGTQQWDEASETTRTVGHDPHYDGGCRVQVLATAPRDVDAADQVMQVTGYLVSVPFDVAATDGHIVALSGTGDPVLDGRELYVRDVLAATIRIERNLLCDMTEDASQ